MTSQFTTVVISGSKALGEVPMLDINGNYVSTFLTGSGGGAGVIFRPGVTPNLSNVFDDFELMFDYLDTLEGPQNIRVDCSNVTLPSSGAFPAVPGTYIIPARSVGQYDFRNEIELQGTYSGSFDGLLFQQQILNLHKVSGPIVLLSDIEHPGDSVLQLSGAVKFYLGNDSIATNIYPDKTSVIETIAGDNDSNPTIVIEPNAKIGGYVDGFITSPGLFATTGSVDIILQGYQSQIEDESIDGTLVSEVQVQVNSDANPSTSQNGFSGSYSRTHISQADQSFVTDPGTNYTNTTTTIEGHLIGIDNKLGTVSSSLSPPGGSNFYVPYAFDGNLVFENTLQVSGSDIGFYNTTPITKPAVSGSGQGEALGSALEQLAAVGLINDTAINLFGVSSRTIVPAINMVAEATGTLSGSNWASIGGFILPDGWAANTISFSAFSLFENGTAIGHIRIVGSNITADGSGSLSLWEVTGSRMNIGSPTTTVLTSTGDISANFLTNEAYVVQAEIYDEGGADTLTILFMQMDET